MPSSPATKKQRNSSSAAPTGAKALKTLIEGKGLAGSPVRKAAGKKHSSPVKTATPGAGKRHVASPKGKASPPHKKATSSSSASTAGSPKISKGKPASMAQLGGVASDRPSSGRRSFKAPPTKVDKLMRDP